MRRERGSATQPEEKETRERGYSDSEKSKRNEEGSGEVAMRNERKG